MQIDIDPTMLSLRYPMDVGLIGDSKEVLRALRVHPCELERGLRVGEIAFGLSDRGLKKRRINLRDHLAGFDLRIKIGKQFRDVAGDLAADLDIDHGIERAGCRDYLRQRTAGDRRRLKIRRTPLPALTHGKEQDERADNDDGQRKKALHAGEG